MLEKYKVRRHWCFSSCYRVIDILYTSAKESIRALLSLHTRTLSRSCRMLTLVGVPGLCAVDSTAFQSANQISPVTAQSNSSARGVKIFFILDRNTPGTWTVRTSAGHFRTFF